MNGLSNAHHFRKTVAGICMLVAPLLLLIGAVVHPETGTSESSILTAAAGDPDAWYASHLLILIAVVLTVPAVLGLMHMLRERQVAFGHVGGGLAMLGLLAFVGIVAIDGFVGWQAGSGDPDQMTALFERLYDSTGFVIPFTVMSFGFGLGMLTLAMGLYRAKAVQSYHALFLAVAAVLLTIAYLGAAEIVAIVGAAFLLIGFGSVGRMVLTESDDDWEHTPEYRGFRQIAGMH